MELKAVTIFTDGGAQGNPGPGGFGTVLLYEAHRKELSGGFRMTTNNRMELMAAIAGLEALKEKCRVRLFSDSKYVVDAMSQGWAENWKRNNWRRNRKEEALNSDLWERLLRLCTEHSVEFNWVRGHAGDRENERCHQLAEQAAKQPNLPIDEYFERVQNAVTESPNGETSAQ